MKHQINDILKKMESKYFIKDIIMSNGCTGYDIHPNIFVLNNILKTPKINISRVISGWTINDCFISVRSHRKLWIIEHHTKSRIFEYMDYYDLINYNEETRNFLLMKQLEWL